MQGISIGYTYKPSEEVPLSTHQTYHFHPQDEMLIVKSGDVVAMTPGSYLSHKGPCIILYKKMCPHAQINLSGTNYERYCINFDRNIILGYLKDLSLFTKFYKNDAVILPLQNDQITRLWTASTLLRDCTGEKETSIKSKLLLSYIIADITDIFAQGEASEGVHFYLTEVTRYISLHISEKLTIDRIAENFKISRTKLIRDFKEFFGMSVLEYITFERLARSKEMLRRGDPVLKVAESCGFIDSAYFIRVFKKHLGLTPASYRKKYTETPNKNEEMPLRINL